MLLECYQRIVTRKVEGDVIEKIYTEEDNRLLTIPLPVILFHGWFKVPPYTILTVKQINGDLYKCAIPGHQPSPTEKDHVLMYVSRFNACKPSAMRKRENDDGSIEVIKVVERRFPVVNEYKILE